MSMRFVHVLIVALTASSIFSACSQAPVRPSVAPATTPPTATIGVKIGRPLKAASDAVAEGNFDVARAFIAEADAVVEKTPLERYKITEVRAYVAGKEKYFTTAESAFEELVNSPNAEAERYSEYLKLLALVTFNNRHYDKTILYGNRWLSRNAQYDATVGQLVANSYYLNRDYVNAEGAIDKMLDFYKKTPRRSATLVASAQTFLR